MPQFRRVEPRGDFGGQAEVGERLREGLRQAGLGQAQTFADARGGDGADGHGLAVRHGEPARGLHRVAHRVAQVERGAAAGLLEGVFLDGAHLHAHRTDDQPREEVDVPAFGREVTEHLHQPRVADDGVFERLGQAAAQFALGEGGEGLGVGEDGAGWMEGADQVFARGQVGPRFAADARVDHRQEGRGQVEPTNAAEPGRGRETGEVAHHAAAQGDDQCAAFHPGREHRAPDALHGGEGLVLFPGGNLEGRNLTAQGREDLFFV